MKKGKDDAGKRFILKKFISPFSIKIRNVSMQMIVLIKEDRTINVPKEIFLKNYTHLYCPKQRFRAAL